MHFLRLFYSLVLICLVPVFLLRLGLKSIKMPSYRHRWAERLGIIPRSKTSVMWFHAVSVGEVEALIPILKLILQKMPHEHIVVTTTTATGSARLYLRLGQQVTHYYFPFDTPSIMKRFVARLKPKVCVLIESELWPNHLYYTSKHCPIILANARLSTRSQARYRRFSGIASFLLKDIHTFLVQGKQEEKLFADLCPKSRVVWSGNTKWDISPSATDREKAKQIKQLLGGRPVWMAASTHAPEEEIAVEAHLQVLMQNATALLILVPRHPERFDHVANLIKSHGLSVARRSKNDVVTGNTQVYLCDTMGEMLALYGASHAVFVGGSFAPKGGHNMLEPLSCGLSIVMGPDYSNFKDIGERLRREGLLSIVHSPLELAVEIGLHLDPQKRERWTSQALAIMALNQGASELSANEIITIAEEKRP